MACHPAMASPDEIWSVDFGDPFPGEPAHHRPAIVVGPGEVFGPAFPFAFVVPLTTTARGLSLHIEVEPTAATGIGATSYAQCELLRSVSIKRLTHRLGHIDVTTSTAIEFVVRTLLGY